MKTLFKIAAALLLLVIIAIIAVVVIVANMGNEIVKAVIERGGTYATQTTTTVDSVKLGLFDGTFSMNGFKIANPTGFTTEHFLTLGDTSVELQPSSITTDVISIPTVAFNNIDVILDKGGNPSNYNTILNSLKRFESAETKAAPDNANAKKVTIDSLTLNNINVRVANMPGVSLLTGDIAIQIPSIQLNNIGKDQPMTAAQVVNLVIKTVLTAAVEAGGGVLPNDILSNLAGNLSDLSSLSDMGITVLDGAGQIVGDQLNNIAENAGKAVEDLTTGAQDAIKGATKDLPENVGKEIENATKDLTDKADEALNEASEELEKGINNLFKKKKKEDD